MTIAAVVLDVEGTTGSTGFVRDTLYPYSRERFASWLEAHADKPLVRAQIDAVRRHAGEPTAALDRVVWWLNHWLDADEKVTALKAIQGWIWDEGFASGALTSHFYDDVIPVLRAWHASGLRLHVFSSGSVTAQRAWFAHSPQGDLLSVVRGCFDTETAGPKKVAASYDVIAAAIGGSGAEIVFLSDVTAELDAAREAGWWTVGVRRPGDQHYEAGVGDHLEIATFDELDLAGAAPKRRVVGR
jgi:enolase-phosphatase E1